MTLVFVATHAQMQGNSVCREENEEEKTRKTLLKRVVVATWLSASQAERNDLLLPQSNLKGIIMNCFMFLSQFSGWQPVRRSLRWIQDGRALQRPGGTIIAIRLFVERILDMSY
jgi:hypothetical protein